jgi:UDP-glucose 4-epimerase
MKNDDLVVFGDNKVLDFTYIDDCVSGIFNIITNFEKAKQTTFNIASGTGHSLVELAELILELTGGNGNIRMELNRTGEVDKCVADISKAKSLIEFQPENSFSEGIWKTVEWYENRPEIRTEVLRQ